MYRKQGSMEKQTTRLTKWKMGLYYDIPKHNVYTKIREVELWHQFITLIHFTHKVYKTFNQNIILKCKICLPLLSKFLLPPHCSLNSWASMTSMDADSLVFLLYLTLLSLQQLLLSVTLTPTFYKPIFKLFLYLHDAERQYIYI